MADILAETGVTHFLRALVENEVEFLVVGASAAVLQGVPLVTQDIDLWFKYLPPDERLKAVLKRVGGIYVPPTGHHPPTLAGEAVKLFDVVISCHGLSSFDEEMQGAYAVEIGDVFVPVLPLERVIQSKKATNRPKDVAATPALETALETIKRRSRPGLWFERSNKRK